MSDVREFLARMLTAEGALVEPIEPDGLEVMAPAHLQQALSLPEWSRIGFGPELPERAVRMNFESDWAERLERLLGERGRLASVFLQERGYQIPQPEFQKLVLREFTLQNATLRVGQAEEARTDYLLLVFRVTAISDEKREDLVYLCINESNNALADDLAGRLLSHLRSRSGAEETCWHDTPAAEVRQIRHIRNAAAGMLLPKIRSQFSPFLAGMERRMARDLERLHVYHSDLQLEAYKRLAEKNRKGVHDGAQKECQMRLQAVKREYHAKVSDLERKYSMSIEVRFLQALHANMPVRRAEVTVLRRKGSRRTHIDWNPIARRLDHFPCEGCWGSPRIYCACDEKLHLVCPSCLSACSSCGKEFCRACNPVRCPKCAHPAKEMTNAE